MILVYGAMHSIVSRVLSLCVCVQLSMCVCKVMESKQSRLAIHKQLQLLTLSPHSHNYNASPIRTTKFVPKVEKHLVAGQVISNGKLS